MADVPDTRERLLVSAVPARRHASCQWTVRWTRSRRTGAANRRPGREAIATGVKEVREE